MSTFVLVHGAWIGGWSYRRVADKMRALGHVVYTPTLTGIGERSHLYHPDIDLEAHVTDVLNVIEWEQLDDIILVGHSYGGMVITLVADRIPEKVSHLVYLDAFVPQDGQSEMDFLPDDQKGFMRAAAAESNNGIPPLPAEFFGLNENDIPMYNKLCSLQPIMTFEQPVKLTGGLQKLRNKRVFIYNEGFVQGPFKPFYDAAVSDPDWATYTLPHSHGVMFDAPEDLVSAFQKLV